MNIPSLYDLDISKKEDRELLANAIRQIASLYLSNGDYRSTYDMLFNFYNGTAYDSEKVKKIVRTHSNKGTVIRRYNLGRSKLTVLPNELLASPIQFSILSVDREANLIRMDRYRELQALSIAKPAIEEIQNEGYSVFDGMQLPDQDTVEQQGPLSIRLEHEQKMQRYIEEKKLGDDMKIKLNSVLIHLMCTNVAFAKVETDFDGKLTFRPISPMNAVTVDNTESPWSNNAPYIGEYRSMDVTTLKRQFMLSKDMLDKLKTMSEAGNIRYAKSNIADHRLLDVFTIQFRNRGSKVIFKTKNVDGTIKIFPISEEYYNKNRSKIEKEVANGEYEIDVRVKERVYEVSYVANNIDEIIDISVVDAATMRDAEGQVYPAYDYIRFKASFVNSKVGEPLASIIMQLDEDYDAIRSMIARELRKPHGNVMAYDLAFLPNTATSYEELRDQMLDTGEIVYNTSADGNASETDSRRATGISSITLGSPETLLQLANMAMMIEQTAERLTGITEARSGSQKASTSATTSNNNLEASRSMTYDIFFNTQRFGEEVVTRMCNKLKSNPVEIDPNYSTSLFDEDEYERFMSTFDMTLSDFKAFINDGRKDAAIIDYLQQAIFPQDIAAGKLTSLDVAEFMSKDTVTEALEVLRKADSAFKSMASQSQQAQAQAEQQAVQQKIDGEIKKEQVRAEAALNLSDRDAANKINVNEHSENKKGQSKLSLEQLKGVNNERLRQLDSRNQQAIADKNSATTIQKSILDGENKLKAKKDSGSSSKPKK